MEHFTGDNDHGNHEFYSIIMVVAMALAASTCVWRSWLVMKVPFFAQYNLFGANVYMSDISAYRNHNVHQCKMQIP